MIAMVRTLGRVLWMHWPVLLAWYLGGTVLRQAVVLLAGLVGGYSAIGMYAILPIAAIARLVAYVAMILVVRDALRELSTIAPIPADPAARRRSFVDGLLGGMLPFLAVYQAWGFLRADSFAAVAVAFPIRLEASQLEDLAALQAGRPPVDRSQDDYFGLSIDIWLITGIVAAYALRWAWKRYRERLPKWTGVVAVYLEALWIYLFVVGVKQIIDQASAWLETRRGMVWLDSIGDWFAEHLVVVARAWESFGWVFGEVITIVGVPLAWLAIVGTIYGQAIRPGQPVFRSSRWAQAKEGVGRIPGPLRRRIGDLLSDFGARFQAVWNAIVLMWRAGPVLVTSFVFLYTLWLAAERLLNIAGPHLLGAHDLQFWGMWFNLVAVVVGVILEPVRVALVASAYDATLGRVARSGGVTLTASPADDEAERVGRDGQAVDDEHERAIDVVGHDEGRPQPER